MAYLHYGGKHIKDEAIRGVKGIPVRRNDMDEIFIIRDWSCVQVGQVSFERFDNIKNAEEYLTNDTDNSPPLVIYGRQVGYNKARVEYEVKIDIT